MAQSNLRATRVAQQVLASAAASAPDARLLQGIRVIELATVVAAPAACALLADLGAEVVKIEPPHDPDITRSWGGGDDPAKTASPELLSQRSGGSAFVQLNRGKRSIALDIRAPEGVALLKQLISTADVFVTNVRLKSLQKLGLDYEALALEFPRLIVGHVSAYGRQGPMAEDPGYDMGAFWAHTGMMDLVRSSEDGPMPRFPGAVGDNSTAAMLAGFIGMALFHRERTGRGQLVDAALMRTGIWAMGHPLSSLAGGNGWATGDTVTGSVRETTVVGERKGTITDREFRCKDNVWLYFLGLGVDRHLPKMCEAFGVEAEAIIGHKWQKGVASSVDWHAAMEVVDGIMATKTYDEWHDIFKAHDVWHVRVNRFEEMVDDPQAHASGIWVSAPGVRHPLLGSPVLLSDSGAGPRATAPAFGQHTGQILREAGVPEAREAELREKGIVR